MSRIGKRPIPIPQKTEVAVASGSVSVKGPLGELSRRTHRDITIEVADGEVIVRPQSETKTNRALWGTYASLIANMVRGVNTAYEKKLVIEGVGYRAEMRGSVLSLSVGYSHPVDIAVPEGITVAIEKNEITVSGPDKEAVGQFAADIRAKKKPEPYKGKGIRYIDEVVRRKQGKKTV